MQKGVKLKTSTDVAVILDILEAYHMVYGCPLIRTFLNRQCVFEALYRLGAASGSLHDSTLQWCKAIIACGIAKFLSYLICCLLTSCTVLGERHYDVYGSDNSFQNTVFDHGQECLQLGIA